MSTVTLNNERELFVISTGHGYTCHGFDALLKELKQLARWLGITPPLDSERGTLAQYQQHQAAISAVAKRGGIRETWFHADTPEAVKSALESARSSRRRVRIYYGDISTGRSWLEEFDVMGSIGRSMGLLKVPLLIASRASSGGPALLDHCIVRIQDVDSKQDLYRHPTFHVPHMRLAEVTAATAKTKDFPWEVRVAEAHPQGAAATITDVESGPWTLHARFETEAKAHAWMAFMRGDRMRK